MLSLILSTEIIQAERLHVVHLTAHSAVLQWRPVLIADSGYYHLWYNSVEGTGSGSTSLLQGDSSTVELDNLQPQTTYTASLRPESNQRLFNTLSVHFTTLPGERIYSGVLFCILNVFLFPSIRCSTVQSHQELSKYIDVSEGSQHTSDCQQRT